MHAIVSNTQKWGHNGIHLREERRPLYLGSWSALSDARNHLVTKYCETGTLAAAKRLAQPTAPICLPQGRRTLASADPFVFAVLPYAAASDLTTTLSKILAVSAKWEGV